MLLKPMSLAAGTNIGRYEVRSQLGAGGMGEVYLAQDTQLMRNVALKVLPAAVADDEERMRRFAQEARAASALNHPNILTIYEIGATDSLHFIATEYIEGVTLRRLLTNEPIVVTAAFDIAIQIAAALAVAHAAGIVHRDIKHENVMLRTDGYVKVLDFGLAKLTEKFGEQQASDPDAPTQRDVVTKPGVVMGTVYFMSPEQARGLEVDARTDVWSLGVVLYEMIAGRSPFTGESSNDVIAAILEKPPPPLARYLSQPHPELQRIINKALAKDREERYQTIKDLLIDLKNLKREVESEDERKRTAPTEKLEPETQAEGGAQETADAGGKATGADHLSGRHQSSAEYIVGEIGRHRKVAALLLALALAAAIYLALNRGRPIDSVAILPFVNSAGPEMEPLGDGMTSSIINNLTQVPDLKVKSHSAVSGYKGKETNPQKIGHELGVSAVLVGNIQKQGDALVINAALIDVTGDFQLWGKQYPVYDIISSSRMVSLQEDISKQITLDMRVKLFGAEGKP